jgi:signal transduction histidine kinase
MAWDEPEEPSFNLATWSQEEFQWDREPPGKWGGLVSESLANKNFLCIDAGAPTPLVLCSSAAGVERWHGAPIDPDLQARFGIRSTLSLAFQGEALKGRLFFLDKKRITTDDILLGVVVARQVMVGMDFFLLLERLQQMAAAQERVRLAGELHDGVLQSMTVMSFKLGAVQRLLSNGRPEEAAAELEGMEELISGEQRELRRLVGQMKPA